MGIGAVIFTVFNVLNFIVLSRQQNIAWWSIALMWPLDLYSLFRYVLSSPGNLIGLPLPVYLRTLIALLSPFLAMVMAKKFGYSRALWFVLVLLFPFILLLVAIRPPTVSITLHEQKRVVVVTAQRLFLAALFTIVSSLPSRGDVVYVIGARWLATDNPIIAAFSVAFIVFSLVMGVSGILVAFGIISADR